MELLIAGETVYGERFETHPDLLNSYRSYEAQRGRVPSAYDWMELLNQLGLFVAGYLGEKALDKGWKKLSDRQGAEPDAEQILRDLASSGYKVKIVLETAAETELAESLRKRLPGVEVITNQSNS